LDLGRHQGLPIVQVRQCIASEAAVGLVRGLGADGRQTYIRSSCEVRLKKRIGALQRSDVETLVAKRPRRA
jgi:hypothetical protein